MHHLTIEELIDRLYEFDDDDLLYTSSGHILDGKLHSYRGIYSDLSLGYHDGDHYFDDPEITVGQMSLALRNVIGDTMYGYKGGEYTMQQDTLCWLSGWNEYTGLKVVGVEEIEGTVYLMTVVDY